MRRRYELIRVYVNIPVKVGRKDSLQDDVLVGFFTHIWDKLELQFIQTENHMLGLTNDPITSEMVNNVYTDVPENKSMGVRQIVQDHDMVWSTKNRLEEEYWRYMEEIDWFNTL